MSDKSNDIEHLKSLVSKVCIHSAEERRQALHPEMGDCKTAGVDVEDGADARR